MPRVNRPNPLRDAMESLRSQSPRLNKITDLANETVREIEAFLNDECSIGVTAVVKMQGDPEGPEGTYLEYRRVGPRFRIAIVESDDDGRDTSVKAWADCPRAVKLDTFKLLPQLMTSIAQRVEKQIAEAEQTANAAAEIIAELRQSTQS